MSYPDGCREVPDTTDEPCRTCGGSCRSADECDHNRFLEVRRYLVEIADRRRLTHNASEERGAPF